MANKNLSNWLRPTFKCYLVDNSFKFIFKKWIKDFTLCGLFIVEKT